MELHEFIEYTLVGINKGVSDANSKLGKGSFRVWDGKEGRIDFDVAVTVSSEKAISGKGGLKIAVVEIGGGGESKSIQENASRIRFSVHPAQVIS